MSISLVLQGPVYPYTNDIVSSYLRHPIVGEVIISCWTTCPDLNVKDSRLKYVRSEDVKYSGIGNINRQLVSSLAGVKDASIEYCAKMRTDQWISQESLTMMDKFFNKFSVPEIHFEDGTGPTANIMVAGMCTRFPFHPRDHIFWGMKTDLLKLLNIPLCNFNKEVPDAVVGTDEYFQQVLRPETYIGAYYYSKFNKSILKFLREPAKYLMDFAPEKEEAMTIYNKLRDKVFKVLPRIEFSWPKHNLKTYHYDVGQSFSEYWYEQPW